MSMFKREIKDYWYPQYNLNGYPHVQQAFLLPPNRHKEFDPFILMAEDWFKRGVFSDHPHRGFQTVTYVIDGRLEHIDNAGGYGILNAGDVQYMNAGWAARHSEQAYGDDLIHTLQLWLNLPKDLKRTDTSYQDIYVEDAPVIKIDGGHVRVYSGEFNGITGPMNSLVPIHMVEIVLSAGSEYTYDIPNNHNGFVFVLAGEFELGENTVNISKSGIGLMSFDDEEDGVGQFKVKCVKRGRLLVYSGVPIRENVALGGPFVMNTEAEIDEAFQDLRNGKFGPPAK